MRVAFGIIGVSGACLLLSFGCKPVVAGRAATTTTTTTTQPAAADEGWGDPSGGLRMRLTARRGRVVRGEPLRLSVELENVARHRLTVARPTLFPVIAAPGDHPYAADEGASGLAVTATPPPAGLEVDWVPQAFLPSAVEPLRLAPGERWRLDVRGVCEAEDGTVLDTNSAVARFAYGRHPGRYQLVARLQVAAKDARGGMWSGTVSSRPVAVEVIEEP